MQRARKVFNHFNPIAHLGNKHYSVRFPFLGTTTAAILLEFYAYTIARNPESISLAAIFVFIGLIIYFSFRDGVKAGFISSLVTIFYYLYIIYTRNYQGERLSTSLLTVAILGIMYLVMAAVVGWLKQTIDDLIEDEVNKKRRLEFILQQLPVGVMITDERGRVVETNRLVEEILGVKFPKDYTIGRDEPLVLGKINNKVASPSQYPILKALTTGKTFLDKDFVIQKAGKQTFLQVSASAIKNRQGKTIAAASIITDITLQKEAEKRKDDFVNMASHELKTPLTSLKLYLDLLSAIVKKSKDEKAIKILGGINAQTNRLQRLVNDLLDVSRLHTGKLKFVNENFRLDSLIKETISEIAPSTHHKINFNNGIRVNINADKYRIYQILVNLLNNAIKYSPQSKNVFVNLQKDKKKVIVRIQDFGIGISKLEQKKIFERLYQVNDDKEKTFPGLGMGLYISREIIKKHKGEIWVESEKDKGSIFYFSLPI